MGHQLPLYHLPLNREDDGLQLLLLHFRLLAYQNNASLAPKRTPPSPKPASETRDLRSAHDARKMAADTAVSDVSDEEEVLRDFEGAYRFALCPLLTLENEFNRRK